MGIMDLFRSNNQAQTQPQGQAQPQGQTPSANPAVGSNPQAPQAGNPEPSPNLPKNPMDEYAKLWEKQDDKNAPPAAPSLSLDPEAIKKAASGLNFMQNVDPELVQKATSGDIQSLMQLINNVGQQAYQASISHGSALTDKFVDARSKFEADQVVGSRVKSELTAQALSALPNYDNPVVREQLNEVARRYQKAFPEATPQQIADMSKKYIQDLAASLNPQSKESDNKPKEIDWASYILGDSNS